jgi:hypothetical protein
VAATVYAGLPFEMTSLKVVLAVDSIPRITACPLRIDRHVQLYTSDKLLDNAAWQREEALAPAKLPDLAPKKKSRTCDFPKISASH